MISIGVVSICNLKCVIGDPVVEFAHLRCGTPESGGMLYPTELISPLSKMMLPLRPDN